MLQTQVVPVSFAQGVDTKTDEKLVVPGKLTLLENGVFTIGQKIKKRNGYTALSNEILGGGTIENPEASGVYVDDLCIFANKKLYSYSQGLDKWIDRGTLYSVEVRKQEVIRNQYAQTDPDMAYSSGVSIFAWKDSRGGVRASVIDSTTGAAIQADTLLDASGDTPRCVPIGGFLFAFYTNGTNIYMRRLNPANPGAFESAVTVANDLDNAAPWFDIDQSGLNAVVVYKTTTGVTLKYVTNLGAIGSPSNGFPSPQAVAVTATNTVAVKVDQDTKNIWVYFHNGSGVQAFIRYPDFTSLLGTTVVDSGATAVKRITASMTASMSQNVYFEVSATNPYDYLIKKRTLSQAGSVGSSSTVSRSVGLYSKAQVVEGVTIFVTVYDSTLQSTLFVMRDDGVIVAKCIGTVANGLRSARTLAWMNSYSDTNFQFASCVRNKFVSDNGTIYTLSGVAQSSLEFDSDQKFISKVLGGNLHIGGGFVSVYDGQSVVEQGFHLFPENIGAVASTSGGSMADGTYLYCFVYSWIDNRGQVHRSAPSVAQSVTVSGGGGAGKVTFTVPTLRLTAKKSPRVDVVVECYRTQVGQSEVFYKVGNNGGSPVSAPLFNDTTADTVTFVDKSTDATIASNEILYTVGGVLENDPLPPAMSLSTYKNRLLFVPTETPNQFGFTKEWVQGESANWNGNLYKLVDPIGGDVNAVQFMDDKIIIFKDTFLYGTAGDPPNDLGLQDQLAQPEIIPSEVGCSHPRSIVLTPKGIMFKSNKGIYMLDRTLSVGYIGADVEQYNAQNVVSSRVVESQNQIRFLTDSGYTLVFDYYFGQWSTFTNHEGLGSDNWLGTYVYLRNDGKMYQESTSVFKDDVLEYKLRIGTAWLKFAGLQGFQRVRRFAVLGKYESPHILRIRLGYDYESSYSDTIYFNAGQIVDSEIYGDDALYGEGTPFGGTEENVYQFVGHLARQKCQSVRFLFEDITTGTPGEAYNLSDLSLEVGLKKGLNKVRVQKKVG